MKRVSINDLRVFSESLFNFFKSTELKNLPDGRYEFENNIYANVESYLTQDKQFRRFESHKKYIDIQFIITGEEIISVRHIKDLTVCDSYSVKNDIAFYKTQDDGTDISLCAGEGLMLMPADGHMPCLNAIENKPSNVKKAVIKIPLPMVKDIRYLLLDVDGTLTDGKIYMSDHGELCKAFNIKDGYGLHELCPKVGILPVIITGRKSAIVENRCFELGIQEIYQGVTDKQGILSLLLRNKNCGLENVAYIGDDLNDLECMCAVKNAGGLVGCPYDADTKVKKVSDFISFYDGGRGAVREFIDWIVQTIH